nr:hypothetical protein [Microbispora rosea]
MPSTPSPVASAAFTGPTARAMPKSITLGPSGPSSTLAGFRSRWTTPARWIAARAVTVPTASRRSSWPRSGPRSATACCSVGPSMNSLTMYGRPSAVPTWRTWAVQNDATRGSTSASRRSAASASGSPEACRTFTATRSPRPDSARYTTPCPPEPSLPSTRWPPISDGSPGRGGETVTAMAVSAG